MMNFDSFNLEEISNTLLLVIKEMAENKKAVSTPLIMLESKSFEQEWINKGLHFLLEKQFIEAEKDYDNCFYNVNLTDSGLKYIQNLETLTLLSTASLVLQKTYDWYIRNNYVMDTQENSLCISYALGICNHEKVRSAIKMLIDKGLLRKWVIMRDFTSFCITADGVTYMEQQKTEKTEDKQSSTSIIINDNKGNISISSENVTQKLSNNQLDAAFDKLEKLINEKLSGEEKQEATENLETAKELLKAEKPKWNLVKKAITAVGSIPVLFETVKSVIDLINQFQM